ncbi:alpha/beta fold hydrolase [Xenophilus azovorans]|uniref:alpha/beta fold hydrolase n=1 Tax=Xenophilus azovorans TaxID=151755 RepID=UPI000A07606D|nr:alpha/beta fold hydrolase [Xenophilus azovorans]
MIHFPITLPSGAFTRVLAAGHGDRHVVLVHGTGGRADRWSRNIDALAEAGLRVWAVDLPGHGYASKGKGVPCSVPAYRAFLAEVMDALAIPKATIVGTSLGGHVVASHALEHPQRVERIVLVGSMGLVPIGQEARNRIQAGANNQTREGVESKLRRVMHDPALTTPELVEEEWRINNSAGALDSFATLGNYIAIDLDNDVIGETLAKSSLPVLLVWGEEDKTVAPAVGRQAREMLANSQLALIAGAAHTAYYEKPEIFNAILWDFAMGRAGRHTADGLSWS